MRDPRAKESRPYKVSLLDSPEDFLLAIKEKHNIPSWDQLARLLGVSRQTVYRYRDGLGGFDEAICPKVAVLLGYPEKEGTQFVLAKMSQFRSRASPAKEAWRQLAEGVQAAMREGAKIGYKALLIGALALPSVLQNQNVRAAELARAEIHICDKRRRRAQGWRKQAWELLTRLLRALALSLGLAAPAAAIAGDWSGADTARELGYQGLLAVDCRQTWQGSVMHPGQFQETNPIMGPNPSKGRVIGACVASSAGHYLISRALPDDWRVLWQSVTIFAELYAVDNNLNAGLGLRAVF